MNAPAEQVQQLFSYGLHVAETFSLMASPGFARLNARSALGIVDGCRMEAKHVIYNFSKWQLAAILDSRGMRTKSLGA